MTGGTTNALERRALQRWNPSADSKAGMAGGGCGRPPKSDSPIANLLRAKNGLDNRNNFQVQAKNRATQKVGHIPCWP